MRAGPSVVDGRLPAVAPVRIDSTEELSLLSGIFDATLVSLDTETVFDPENPGNLEQDGPGAWRVTSLAARMPDGQLRTFVVDMGHVDAAALQQLLASWLVFRLRRFLHEGGELPGTTMELLELGDLDAADAVAAASGQLRYELDGLRSRVGAEVVAWNANFDRHVLARDGVDVVFMRDAMLYQAILDLGRTGVSFYTSLAKSARQNLGVEVDGKGSTQLSYREVEQQPELSDEQVRYAADDALVTLLLFEQLSTKVSEAGLSETVELEVNAQSFIDSLTRFGLPLDIEGWRSHLAEAEASKQAAEARLAELTGSQSDLFGNTKLDWSPSKDADIRRVLNEFEPDRVRRYFASKERRERLFGREDSVDKTVMTQIGGDIVEAILAWKKAEKIGTTYGEELVSLADSSGRLHPRYLQAVVATGRLASNRPNAQNLSPQMKPFIRPRDGRVFVYADLGQAELRMLAQVSADEVLRRAFHDGADIHITTAEGMFKVDVASLMAADTLDDDALRSQAEQLSGRGLLHLTPSTDAAGEDVLLVAGVAVSRPDLVAQLRRYGSGLRARGKTLNFGVCYGLRANSLATQLSVAGVETTRAEAQELLRLYDDAYPGISRWLQARDEFVAQLAANPPEVDFEATLELALWHPQTMKADRALRKQLGRPASVEEVFSQLVSVSELSAELSAGGAPVDDELLEAELARRRALVASALSMPAPVLVAPGGAAVAFESRTPAGRRRIFNIGASAWVREMAMVAARSEKEQPVALRHRFEQEHNLVLSDAKYPKRPVAFAQLKKRLTDTVAQKYLQAVREQMPHAMPWLYQAGLSEAIRALGNQYRNAPIQGGVADAALWAYAEIQRNLSAFFPDAHGVQTVHDSITIECDAKDAVAVGEMLQRVMQDGLGRYTPDVPAVADMKILSSMDEKSVVAELSKAA